MKTLIFDTYTTQKSIQLNNIQLGYQIFGNNLTEDTPTVVVCHALTGNSNVSGESGWWNQLIGPGKLIDPNTYRIIGFDIPGNGYNNPKNLINNFDVLTTYDIAHIFQNGLNQLGITSLHSVIGGSLGGMIVWELAVHFPELAENYITIGSDFRSSDWVIAQNFIQEQIIKNAENGIELARQLSMLFYRTPQDYQRKFNRSWNEEKNTLNVKSYLTYQGEKLKKRMSPLAYRTMTHLLSSCSVAETPEKLATKLSDFNKKIHIVGIESDILFPASECKRAYEALLESEIDVSYNEIVSDYGHDAFLIEYEQLTEILKPVYSVIKTQKREIEPV